MSISATDAVKGFQTVRDTASAISQPLDQLANTGLDFLLFPFVYPVLQIFEMAVGDPEQLEHHSAAWTQAAAGLRQMVADQKADLTRVRVDWQGDAADAYAKRIQTMVDGLETSVQEMLQTADTLGDSAMDIRNGEELIRNVIRELIEYLVIGWLAALALEYITGGASVAAQATNSVGASAVSTTRAARILMKIREGLAQYNAFLQRLRDMGTMGKIAAMGINKFFGPKHFLKSAIKAVTPLSGSYISQGLSDLGDMVLDATADEYDDRQKGLDGNPNSRLRKVAGTVNETLAGN